MAEVDSGSVPSGGLNDEDASADPSATLALAYGKTRKNDVRCSIFDFRSIRSLRRRDWPLIPVCSRG